MDLLLLDDMREEQGLKLPPLSLPVHVLRAALGYGENFFLS